MTFLGSSGKEPFHWAAKDSPETRGVTIVDIDRSDFGTKVLLSLQRALWGMVTPDIRAVAVGWDTGIIRVRVIFDHAVTAEDLDVVSEIETSVLADFGPGVTSDFTADFSKDPFRHLPGERWWAYVRHEE